MMAEVWKDIPGYEGLYQISNLGNVYSVRSKKQLATSKRTTYSLVCLSKTGKHECFYLHRLVAKAFVPNPENKPQVNHINCNRHDNRAENLEWVTWDENLDHYIKSEKFQRIQKAPQRFYWTKGNSAVAEYDLIVGSGTSKKITTGEIVPNSILIDSGYKIHCEILSDYWGEK